MEVIKRTSLFLSSALRIFLDTLTVSEKGTIRGSDQLMESSQDNLGPLVEIGSLTTCTKTC
jgi:hypothetical protein